MRDKKMFLSVILIVTAMLFAGGCGKQAESVSAERVEMIEEVDTEEGSEPTLSPTVEPVEGMEGSEAPDSSEKEVAAEEESGQDLEYEIISIDDTVMYATSNCNIRSGAGTEYDKVGSLSYAQEVTVNGKVEAGEDKLWYVIKTEDGSAQMVNASMLSETKPVAQISSIDGSGSGDNSGGNTGDTGNSEAAPIVSEPVQTAKTETTSTETAQTGTMSNESVPATSEQTVPTAPEPAPVAPVPVSTPAPTPAPAPVHEHVWKDHTATKETWVPNIVVVDDYETKPGEPYDVAICDCGFETTNQDAIVQHFKENGHGFTIQTHYTEQETVWVGSHEEDLGGYVTETYIDYQYCDCGATR